MPALPWYKREPQNALDGMFKLSLEERGAYNTILDLLYLNDGKLHDDDRWLAGHMRCDVRVWKRIRQTLIEAGKLLIDDGFISNAKATSVVTSALASMVSTAELNRTKGLKSGEVRRKNKGLDEPKLNRSRTDKDIDIEKEVREGEALSRPAPSDPDPLDIAFKAYNDMASSSTPQLPQAQSFNKTRRASMARRLAEVGGLPGWDAALAKVAASAFCHGENDRGWVADLDFLLQQSSFTKLMEGKYDNRPGRTNGKARGHSVDRIEQELLADIRERHARHNGGSGEAGDGPAEDVPRLRSLD